MYNYLVDENGRATKEKIGNPVDGYIQSETQIDTINNRYIGGTWQKVVNPVAIVLQNEPTLEDEKSLKLSMIDSWIAIAITNGFLSRASGITYLYDSEQVDQENIKLMHQASLDPTFDTDPVYQGQVPIRGVPEGEVSKEIVMHSKSQLQALISDLARHIGACKVRGWQLQAEVAAATTQEELEAIVW